MAYIFHITIILYYYRIKCFSFFLFYFVFVLEDLLRDVDAYFVFKKEKAGETPNL